MLSHFSLKAGLVIFGPGRSTDCLIGGISINTINLNNIVHIKLESNNTVWLQAFGSRHTPKPYYLNSTSGPPALPTLLPYGPGNAICDVDSHDRHPPSECERHQNQFAVHA